MSGIHCLRCKSRTPDVKPRREGNHIKAGCQRCGGGKSQLAAGHKQPKRGPSRKGMGIGGFGGYGPANTLPNEVSNARYLPENYNPEMFYGSGGGGAPGGPQFPPNNQRSGPIKRPKPIKTREPVYQDPYYESKYDTPYAGSPLSSSLPIYSPPIHSPMIQIPGRQIIGRGKKGKGFMVPSARNPSPARSSVRPYYEGGCMPTKKRKGGALVQMN